ncbi:MAG: ROK family protein [Candidatus Acidiferrales bacterium]
MATQDALHLGVDIGGTKVAAGLVDSSGEIAFRTRVPMNARGTAAEGLDAVQRAIEQVRAARPDVSLDFVGITSPGPLDPGAGVVLNPPNVPCWRNFPLAREVERVTGLHVRLDNDANAAGLAEAFWGAGRAYRNVFYTTLGTGIGTGIILDGQIYHGRTGAAGEGGHTTIDYRGPRCACGKRGCIETLAAGPAIAARAREKVAHDAARGARLLVLAGGAPEKLSAEIVAEAWREGDTLAREVLEETWDLLAIWLGNIVDLLEPDVFIFGGGIGELASHGFGRIREVMQRWSINSRSGEIPLLLARYGADAGIPGAAALGFAPGTIPSSHS